MIPGRSKLGAIQHGGMYRMQPAWQVRQVRFVRYGYIQIQLLEKGFLNCEKLGQWPEDSA